MADQDEPQATEGGPASSEHTRGPGVLTHVNERGAARLVDITGKQATERRAVAKCQVALAPDALQLLAEEREGAAIFAEARAVGIVAAKRTSWLIPLCHPILVGDVFLDFSLADDHVEVEAVAEAFERTGVEMEALTACGVAALSIVGALRKFEPRATIGSLTLWEKTGGRSGHWRRAPDGTPPPGK